MGKTKEDIQQERDTKLYEMDHAYQSRQNEIENEKAQVKAQAEAKQAKGENCSAEVNRYNELSAQQDKNFDDYKAERQQVYDYYDSEIASAEKEEEEEYDY